MRLFDEHRRFRQTMLRLIKPIRLLEVALLFSYSLSIVFPSSFALQASSIYGLWLFTFTLLIGFYMLFDGLGVITFLRLHPPAVMNHPFTTPVSAVALLVLLLMSIFGVFPCGNAWVYIMISSLLCALSCPITLMIFSLLVFNPMRIYNLYRVLEQRLWRKF